MGVWEREFSGGHGCAASERRLSRHIGRFGTGLAHLQRRGRDSFAEHGAVTRGVVLGGQSLLRVCQPAVIQERVDLGAHGPGVGDVLLLALAGGRALSLEGPCETHGLAAVLGDGGLHPSIKAVMEACPLVQQRWIERQSGSALKVATVPATERGEGVVP